jgi:hypothetical protein
MHVFMRVCMHVCVCVCVCMCACMCMCVYIYNLFGLQTNYNLFIEMYLPILEFHYTSLYIAQGYKMMIFTIFKLRAPFAIVVHFY